MTIRGLRLRAILLPLGMAFLSIAGVGWYGLVQIPAQGRYVNERNLRLLRTRAAQIKAKVDNFDHAIDHALESLTQDGRTSAADVKEGLREYVRVFSRGDLEIRRAVVERTSVAGATDASGSHGKIKREAASEESDEDKLLRLAADPPVVMVQRDEGKSYLYIGSKPDGRTGGVSKVLVRSSIEDLARYYLLPGTEFDAVLLTDRTGLVIAQSAAPVNLARIDTVIDAAAASQKTALDQSPGERFASLAASSNVVDVKIGDAAYKLYVEPVQLSLKPLPAAGSNGAEGSGSERWLLCGLVRMDHFRSESAAISYTYLLWFSSVLAAICLGIPLVKLKVISPRERFSAHDSVWVAVAIFAGAGLLTTIVMDAYTFRYEFRPATDQRLRSVADALRGHLSVEIDAIQQEFDELHAAAARIFDSVKGSPKIVVLPAGHDVTRRTDCRPQQSCEWELLEAPQHGGVTPTVYPYFDLASWNDAAGTQRVKWSTVKAVTPFLNIKDEKLPHYQELERAWRLGGATAQGRSSGINVLMSPTTSEPITVFWRAVSTPTEYATNIGQSMSMSRPVSLDRPILPNHVRFAVIDQDGRVMFHADGARILKESFFKECEDDPALRSTVQAGTDAFLTAYYLGKPTRMYVTRLLRNNTFADPRWSLIVLQDYTVIETLNLETLTLALTLFAAFAALLALGSWLLHWLTPRRWAKWFWPDPRKRRGYIAAGVLNGAAILLFVVTSGRVESMSLVALAAVLMAGAIAATWFVVTRADDPDARTVGREFFWARAAFLFVIAGLPAVVCFRVAYDFEARTLVKSEELHETIDRAARRARIDSRVVDRLALRTRSRINDYVSARVARSWDDDQMPLFPPASRDAALQTRSTQLDALLGLIHRPYNEIAVDLKAASASLEADAVGTPAMPLLPFAAIVGALVCAFYAALRWLVKPMFTLDASPAAASKKLAPALDFATRVIVIGPPGSGKSTRLANDARIRIFDVRTLAYHERRRHAKPVQIERRAIAHGTLARVVGSISVPAWAEPSVAAPAPPVPAGAEAWAGSFDYTTLPPDEQTAIGIDHLDHRLDEPEFRAETLTFLEELVYRRNRRLRVASDRDPLACIADSPLADARQASIELDRWTRVLQSFRKESASVADELDADRVGAMAAFADVRNTAGSPARAVLEESRRSPQLMRIGEALLAGMTPGDVLDAEHARRDFGAAAEPYYQAVWHMCTVAERLTLLQLAEEGVVNPRNQAIVRQLLRAGLIVRDPVLRIMNETFRRFVLQAATPDQVSAWERTGVQLPWASIETALVTLVIGVAGLLVATQEQLLGAWIGFVPTLAPAVPTMWKLFAQRTVKGEGGVAAVHV